MIRKLTSFSTRHRWMTVVLWTVLGTALTFVGGAMMYDVTDSQAGDFLPKKYDSAVALRIAEEDFGTKPDANALTVLVARDDGGRLTPADQRHITGTAADLGRERVVGPKPEPLMKDHSQTPRVSPGAVAPDKSFRLLTVSLDGNPNDPGLQKVYKEFRDHAKGAFAKEDLRVGFTGGIASTVDDVDAEETTGKVVSALTMGLIVLLNVLVFRSVAAAIVPLIAVALIGGVASGAVVGAAKLFGIELDASTPSLISVVLLGIGIDYFLFLMFRFREQLRNRPDQDAREAAAETTGRVGSAITSAALTIVAAFATLGLASFGQFRVLGPAIAISVLVMLLASLTLMPALLAVFGRGMFWPARAWKKEHTGGVAARLGHAVSSRPLRYALGSLVLLGALGAGAVGIKMSYDQQGTHETAAVRTAEQISRSLPAGVSDPHSVYVRSTDGTAIKASALGDMTRSLGKAEGVGEVGKPVLNKDRTAARVDLFLSVKSDTQKARDLVSGPVRETAARTAPEGTKAYVTGTAAVFADIATAVEKDLRLVFPVAALLIAVILFLLLRSLLAPVVLMIAVGLGFLATLGASTLLFQHGLDRPGVSFTLPLVLFLFVVALGTDYNILITDRIREEMEKPVTARHAVAEAVRHTAPAIATAGVVLAGSFASLAASPATQEIGFATGLGIILSSLVLSLVLVPALAAVLGRGLWWPRRSRRTPQHHDHSMNQQQYYSADHQQQYAAAPAHFGRHAQHAQHEKQGRI
ncbi:MULTISPECIES: MMPL family transporter [unclassified Streptomyces]|uniref:MMPL family transporter n=1 Tax=unclassified Streptomyces TaxID=2593676 RepID=UPI00136CDEE1|nr:MULTISPECIES: MMPL family transporter [unclassified Streptomyces]NEA05862.1 MMPL family transporter [Streptomyces sp. SID10116]MYY85481.1 MMPL family transporter [Streptomyces sp. SID335]MYZ17534.1 MMPL family transporter [Streptomyces sp. SID337]NDZ89392.1 MMPL family transporter [Streptomyces sp. SID10115]NEB44175.1 MMPL family transporter [Streptomyces sp. SID339]